MEIYSPDRWTLHMIIALLSVTTIRVKREETASRQR